MSKARNSEERSSQASQPSEKHKATLVSELKKRLSNPNQEHEVDSMPHTCPYCGEPFDNMPPLAFLQMQPYSPQLTIPSFLGGAAHAIDLGGVLVAFDFNRNPYEVDAYAMASDWHVAAHDLMNALVREEARRKT